MVTITILVIISLVFVIATVILLISSVRMKLRLRQTTMELSDIKNNEIDIQAKVENVKDEMKLITDLYIASDELIHLTSEEDVYKRTIAKINEFYHCDKFLLYSYQEEKSAYIKKYCHPNGDNFPKIIKAADMQPPEIKNSKIISSLLVNSIGAPLFYIKLEGKKIKTPTGYLESSFTNTDLNVFNIYLKQNSMVLDKLKAYEKMEKMALTDNLTGLYNRHYAYSRLKQEINRASRERYPISILFVDIDKFKSINDNYGHDVGDLALKHIASIVDAATREYDVAIRWGGEEFILILPNTSEEGAAILGERLREQIQTSNFKYCKMTASLGLSVYPYDNDNMDKIISYADSALYYAKDSGRNKLAIYSQVAEFINR